MDRLAEFADFLTNKCVNETCPFKKEGCPLKVHSCDDVTQEDWLNELIHKDYSLYQSIFTY